LIFILNSYGRIPIWIWYNFDVGSIIDNGSGKPAKVPYNCGRKRTRSVNRYGKTPNTFCSFEFSIYGRAYISRDSDARKYVGWSSIPRGLPTNRKLTAPRKGNPPRLDDEFRCFGKFRAVSITVDRQILGECSGFTYRNRANVRGAYAQWHEQTVRLCFIGAYKANVRRREYKLYRTISQVRTTRGFNEACWRLIKRILYENPSLSTGGGGGGDGGRGGKIHH